MKNKEKSNINKKRLENDLNNKNKEKRKLEKEKKDSEKKKKEIQQKQGIAVGVTEDKKENKKKQNEKRGSGVFCCGEKPEGTGSEKKIKNGKSETDKKLKGSENYSINSKLSDKIHQDLKKDSEKITEPKDIKSNLVKQFDNNSINLNYNFEDKKMGGNNSTHNTTLDDLNRQNTELTKQINAHEINIEQLKKTIDELKRQNYIIKQDNDQFNKQHDKLNKENDELKKENQKLRVDLDDLKKFKEKIDNERKNAGKYNPENKFDIALNVDSLRSLINGWKIQFSNEYRKRYDSLKNEKILKIGLLGLKNSGKSFVLSKILGENIFDKKETEQLYLRFVNLENKTLAFIDPPGTGRSMKKSGVNEIKEGNKYDEEEKNIEQTDNFLINFIIKKSDFLIVVVGALNIYEQKLILKLKAKDLEHKEAFSKLKRIFIIHNLKEFSKKEEIKDHIKNVILNSKTFNLAEKESQLTQKVKDTTKNTKYLTEENENKEIEIYHLILAKDKTEAGNYYNQSTYNLIISQFNYFFGSSSFDLINEIKKEILTVSDKIFIKPLKSLEDFEKTSDAIKVKKENTFISKSGDNTDFSFIKLKPKYSYFKVEQNKKLLIIIEMPGVIENQKLSCSSPKSGFYSITFSGKKVLNYPEIPEKEKKDGLFYNNREEGEFKEVFKIKQSDFTLASHKCIKEEKEDNGVYKYYFKLVTDDDEEY